MFSTKQKVYTTESKAINKSEDVGIEGKRYPTNVYGRFLARKPFIVFLLFIIPFAFFIIGCISLGSKVNYDVADFRLSSNVLAQKQYEGVQELRDGWSNILSRGAYLNSILSHDLPRSYVQSTIEIRYAIDSAALTTYKKRNNVSDDSDLTDLLNPNNLQVIKEAEGFVRNNILNFSTYCFTNNLEGGVPNQNYPDCVPFTNILQYFYPQIEFDSNNDTHWVMSGTGSIYQKNAFPRMLTDSNSLWFVDSNFSSSYPHTRQLRTVLALASTDSSPPESWKVAARTVTLFVLTFLKDSLKHPFIRAYVGGTDVELAKTESAASDEIYKIGIVAPIVFIISWWHCATFFMGFYTVFQVYMNYLAAVGLYWAIYRSVPLLAQPAILWITTFGMHGTLTFYDMFVFTGVMATKGRQNNLSVAQRICFTMRRTSLGVWIASILAIVIFAINTTSSFASVKQISILMMIASLWNMFFIVTVTPAAVLIHHYRFSGKRRNLQKQRDVLNQAARDCRRSEASLFVLRTVQENLSVGETRYTIDEDIYRSRIGANRGINKQSYKKGLGSVLMTQMRQGINKLHSAKRDVAGAVHKAKKTKAQLTGDDVQPVEMPAFQMDDFMEVGYNPLGDGENTGTHSGPPPYNNFRMVPPSDLIHINPDNVYRSEFNWENMHRALGQPLGEDDELVPPHVFSLQTVSSQKKEMNQFFTKWMTVAERLRLTVSAEGNNAEALPLVARTVVRAQDPVYIVGGEQPAEKASTGEVTGEAEVPRKRPETFTPPNSDNRSAERRKDGKTRETTDEGSQHEEDGVGDHPREGAEDEAENVNVAAASKVRVLVDPGTSGLSVKKLRDRWRTRKESKRSYCWGLLGRVEDESAEHRMERLMQRKVKREGYTLFERILLQGILPVIFLARWLLGALLVILFILVCIFGSKVTSAKLPASLVNNDNGVGEAFARLDNTWGLQGSCLYCGAYYSNLESQYRTATSQEVSYCMGQGFTPQMNIFPDSCGVCGGDNACLDCKGVPNGNNVITACGGCEAPSANTCTCANTHECSYCDWALGTGTGYGGGCSTTCNALTTCGNTSTCNTYTGTCNSDLVVSEQCGGRGTPLQAANSPTGAAMCACKGHWRGPACELCDCLNGGMCDPDTGACVCVGAFTGPRCGTCAASCVKNGACPSTPVSDPGLLNVRTCIEEYCNPDDTTSPPAVCSSCVLGNSTSPYYDECTALSTSETCMANINCYWSTSCLPARRTAPTTELNCVCTSSNIYGGERCQTCLGPKGSNCTSPTTIVGCDGKNASDYRDVLGENSCGVCGVSGYCRGCDSVAGSNVTFDECGVCGGNGDCTNVPTFVPVTIEYMINVSRLSTEALLSTYTSSFLKRFFTMCRTYTLLSAQGRSPLEDYLQSYNTTSIASIQSLYDWADAGGRLGEIGFRVPDPATMEPTSIDFFSYTVNLDTSVATNESSVGELYGLFVWLQDNVLDAYVKEANFLNLDVDIMLSSSVLLNANAEYLSAQSLWFAVGIGLAVTFVFLWVYYLSVVVSFGGTLVAGIVCFGTLTVCTMFDWRLDAVLQVCMSCTIPLGVEYVVHISSGYFDYLQSTSSHLFAREVSRKTAVQGAMLRSLASVLSTVVTVILCSIMFDVSHLIPYKRTGEVCITMHLIILIALLFFVGLLSALGPMTSYQHWTLSTIVCLGCGILACISVAIIYGAGGVYAPNGSLVLGDKRKKK